MLVRNVSEIADAVSQVFFPPIICIFCLTSVTKNDNKQFQTLKGRSMECAFLSIHFKSVLMQIAKCASEEIIFVFFFLHFWIQ